MDEIKQKARELLAAEYDKIGLNGAATYIRSGQHGELDKAIICALEQALTQQRGPTPKFAMGDAFGCSPVPPDEEAAIDAAAGFAKVILRLPVELLGEIDHRAQQDGCVRNAYLRELLARVHTTPQPSVDAVREGYYLASFKRSHDRGYVTWWMADNAGYTSDLNQAGIYTELTPGYHDSEYTVPVPVSFIDRLRVRRMVDVGDSDNRALWTANDLRAALANELESLLSAASGEKGVG